MDNPIRQWLVLFPLGEHNVCHVEPREAQKDTHKLYLTAGEIAIVDLVGERCLADSQNVGHVALRVSVGLKNSPKFVSINHYHYLLITRWLYNTMIGG